MDGGGSIEGSGSGVSVGSGSTGVAVGDFVAVTADDVAAAVDVQAWCRMRGQEYAGSEEAPDGVPTYLVRRLD